MNLYVMRHAHAMKTDDWRGPDSTRPLTERGHTAAQAAALGLKRSAPQITCVLTSPYTRALETAQIAAAALDTPIIKTESLEPVFDITRLADVLEESNWAHDVLLVGHQPSLSIVLTALTGLSLDETDLKKAAVALVEIPEEAVRQRRPLKEGTLRWITRWDEWDEKAALHAEPIEHIEPAEPAQ